MPSSSFFPRESPSWRLRSLVLAVLFLNASVAFLKNVRLALGPNAMIERNTAAVEEWVTAMNTARLLKTTAKEVSIDVGSSDANKGATESKHTLADTEQHQRKVAPQFDVVRQPTADNKANDAETGQDVGKSRNYINIEMTTSTETAAICLFEKHEDRYLEEWARYHLRLGFAHIYIYDNSPDQSTTKWMDLQDEYMRQRVTVIDHSKSRLRRRQMNAYAQCIRDRVLPNNHTWAAMFDPDEFLVLKQPQRHKTVVDMLQDVCPSSSSTCGSVSMNWVIFGTSNQTSYDPLPVSERFKYHIGMDSTVKTIVRASEYVRQRTPHWAYLRNDTMRVDTHGNFIKGKRLAGVDNPTFHETGTIDIAAVYHYKTKSVAEYNRKYCERGYAFTPYGSNITCEEERRTLDQLPVGHIFDDTVSSFLREHEAKYWAAATATKA